MAGRKIALEKLSHLTHLLCRRGTRVLSVGLSAGADYYAEAQAAYYLGGAEPVGRWWNGPGHFGLADGAPVDPEFFRTLHGGFHPRTGTALVQNAGDARRRGGYDLCFSADKTISALWAVAPEAMRVAIEEAQETAARAGLALMQERAGWTRRGKGGATRERIVMFGALFQHGDTRAGDPDLHTHSVIFNAARREDGGWGSVANEDLFRWKMAAGAVYRAELAAQLRERLGLELERHGDRAEFIRVKGVPAALCAEWSKRRAGVVAAATEKGFETGGDAARAAGLALALRGGKRANGGRETRWRAEAEAAGWTVTAAAELRGRAIEEPADARNRAWREVKEAVRAVVRRDSVFAEQKLWQVTAEAAATAFPARDLPGLIRRLEAEGVVVRLPDPPDGQRMFSTRAAIEDEVAVRALARRAATATALTVPETMAWAAVAAASPTLSGEQRDAALHVLTGPGGVGLIEGAPGAGKTTLLRPVVQGYRAAGVGQVVAVAIAWRQARDLGGELAADDALAADVLLSRWRAGALALGPDTLIIVDELGQWSAAQTRALLEMRAETGCRVIGVGDRRQLQPIGAGPGMRLLTWETAPAVVDTILRQTDPAAREAVGAVMAGDARTALAAHRERGHVIEAPSHAGAVALAAARWRQTREAGASVAVIAETWVEVRALSLAIRGELCAMGLLSGDDVSIKASGNAPGRAVTLAVAVGDELRFRLRDDRLGVVNGDFGRVVGITGTRLTMELTGGRRVEVDPALYRDSAGHCPLTHAYATTLAAAQGLTVDAPILLASPRLRREAATVGLSRGRGWTTIVIDRGAVAEEIRARRPDDRAREPVTSDEVDEHLARAWSRSGRKVAALDYLEPAQVAAWLEGWSGGLPADALSPSGRPPAEVVSLSAARERRRIEADGRRLDRLARRLEAQGERIRERDAEEMWAEFDRTPNQDEEMEPWPWDRDDDPDEDHWRPPTEAERQREAEAVATLRALLLDGRSITQDADGRYTFGGLSEEQLESVDHYWLALAGVAREEALRQAKEHERRRAAQEAEERRRAAALAAELEGLTALVLDGRAITHTATSLVIDGLTGDQLAAVTRHWSALSVLAVRRAAEQAEERRRAAALAVELEGLTALVLDGRAITHTATGLVIDGLTADQLAAVTRHWPALSALAVWRAAEQTEERRRAAALAAELEGLTALVLNGRAITHTATGLVIDGLTADQLAAVTRHWPALSEMVTREAVRQAEERQRAARAIPEKARSLLAAASNGATPETWRTTLAAALGNSNRVESGAILRGLADEIDVFEDRADRYRRERAPLEAAVRTTRQAVEAADAELWRCCRQASRDPEADLPGLEALSRTLTEREASTLVFAPPSGLRGGVLFDREERRQAERAAEIALRAALRLRTAREAARAATATLDAFDAGSVGRAGWQAQDLANAMASALERDGLAFNASAELRRAARALERTASLAELHSARVPDDTKQAIWADQQKRAEQARHRHAEQARHRHIEREFEM